MLMGPYQIWEEPKRDPDHHCIGKEGRADQIWQEPSFKRKPLEKNNALHKSEVTQNNGVHLIGIWVKCNKERLLTKINQLCMRRQEDCLKDIV